MTIGFPIFALCFAVFFFVVGIRILTEEVVAKGVRTIGVLYLVCGTAFLAGGGYILYNWNVSSVGTAWHLKENCVYLLKSQTQVAEEKCVLVLQNAKEGDYRCIEQKEKFPNGTDCLALKRDNGSGEWKLVPTQVE
jgi:hypothetical protein